MDDESLDSTMPSSASSTDELLDWCGKDVDRLHQVYMSEMVRHPGAQRPGLLSMLRHRLSWPLPDDPPETVLTYAGKPSFPLARALAVEESRPPQYQRPELIAELRRRVAAAGENATSVAPKITTSQTPTTQPAGIFR